MPPNFICFEIDELAFTLTFYLWRRHSFRTRTVLNFRDFRVLSALFCVLKGSAPLKLPATHCLSKIFSTRLGTARLKRGISLATPRYPKARFKVSLLCYALIKQPQYEATVKLLGSFRLTAGRGHLHPHCIFTEQVLETVSQSLRHSCTSELHVQIKSCT